MKPIKILLAEDHTVVREGLRALLEADGDIQVVAEAATGRQAVQSTKALHPDVVVMDLAMPLLNGLEATRQILSSVPGTRVIILSAHAEDAYLERVTELGVSGYLLKQTSAHVLSRAVREVHKGGSFFSPSLTRKSRTEPNGSSRRPKSPAFKAPQLSAREAEVLQLIAEGQANKQVAAELGISVKTVEKHRQHLMAKLDIHDTAGLTRYAVSNGIIESGVRLTIV